MPIQILMPALSPTMEEGKLAKWAVKEGDAVSSGDVIAEIETDKATMEVEAVDEGTIGKLLVEEGTEGVKVNAPIAVLLEDGESTQDISAVAIPAPPPKPVGAPKEKASATASPPPAATLAAAPPPTAGSVREHASPLARRLAADAGLDLSKITGSGPHGRIVKFDVETARAQPDHMASAQTMASTPNTDMVKALYEEGTYEEIALDGMRKTIAARISEAKQSIPHFYLSVDIQLDALLAVRKQVNNHGAARGVKVSVNDFIVKASALALQSTPDCNVAWAGDRVLRFKHSDVAVAVAIEGGLLTPVVRKAEGLSLSQISATVKDLAGRAKSRKLTPHEYQGGSFTISNLGMFGIKNFSAIINPPHGSILAVGAGEPQAIVVDGKVRIATVMSVTLSVDHRAIDGALGAAFLQDLKGYLENPISMLF